MNKTNTSVRNISDTARWVACFRARETEKPNALFRDPYAARLAGDRGFDIAQTLADGNKHEWSWAARTYLFDEYLIRSIKGGADLIVNLAAGLDARPYRMELPEELQWVEIDLPEILLHKQVILAQDKPKCRLERIHMDLSDTASRRKLFRRLNRQGKQIVVICEGLLLYLTADEVASLAIDLAQETHFVTWLIDLVSPGQLRLLARTWGKQLREAGLALQFAPTEGLAFFARCGWKAKETRGLMTTAAELGRLPRELELFLPEPEGTPGNVPWTGVCLLKKHVTAGEQNCTSCLSG
jgi:methyltransferase (TIGR00027 family)